MSTPRENYLTTDEIAEILNRAPRTVAWWRTYDAERSPPYIKINGRVLYPESKFWDWLDETAELTA